MVTPQIKAEELAQAIGLEGDLYLKREDLHPYGSHKGRSIPKMLSKYAAEGWKSFVISSSGNAALAAAIVVKKLNLELSNKILLAIYVGKDINNEKFDRISIAIKDEKNISIKQVTHPKHEAFLEDKLGKAKNLRQSTDDMALKGYEELAGELGEIKKICAIFIPTSSGTTAQGLYLGFENLGLHPQIHIAQTDECHPIADASVPSSGSASLADAIVDKIGHRKNAINDLMKKSNGRGWIISNEEILDAITLVKRTENLDISPNSALSVAGLKKAVQNGYSFDGPVVCLITGL
ncbi:MAG: PLP-dependent lyase/thiolase [Candidatus Magasanikbacteria bacterium]|nr:PLP-dependent lyase/thiolase [Candidatus Magasanikbacteria bacterium]